MSTSHWQTLQEPVALKAQVKDLGPGAQITRYLPHMTYRAVGPFVFFDNATDLHFAAGTGMDVRPHPHIGLSTLSYLLKGQIHHRDSLGTDMILHPGNVLLMTSGEGIVHSERTPQALRDQAHDLQLLQFWLALPQAQEQMAPEVKHTAVENLPVLTPAEGLRGLLAVGHFAGQTSPITTYGDPLFVDLTASHDGHWALDTRQGEYALFVLSGQLHIAGQRFSAPAFVCLPQQAELAVDFTAGSQFFLLGGPALDGPRTLWWNLVASRPELIEAAKKRWRDGGFATVPGDDSEFIPLPEH